MEVHYNVKSNHMNNLSRYCLPISETINFHSLLVLKDFKLTSCQGLYSERNAFKMKFSPVLKYLLPMLKLTGLIYNRTYSQLSEVGASYTLSGMLAEYEMKMATASPEEQQFLTQKKAMYEHYYTDMEYEVNPESFLMNVSRANAVELFFTALSLLICAVGGAVASLCFIIANQQNNRINDE